MTIGNDTKKDDPEIAPVFLEDSNMSEQGRPTKYASRPRQTGHATNGAEILVIAIDFLFRCLNFLDCFFSKFELY